MQTQAKYRNANLCRATSSAGAVSRAWPGASTSTLAGCPTGGTSLAHAETLVRDVVADDQGRGAAVSPLPDDLAQAVLAADLASVVAEDHQTQTLRIEVTRRLGPLGIGCVDIGIFSELGHSYPGCV